MPLTLAEEIRKCDTEKLIGILEHHLYLDGDDLSIIREKKITGRIFFKLTEDKLEKWGIPDGTALAIVDFINKLTSEEKEYSSKRRKIENVKTSSTTAMNISSGTTSFFHDSDVENWSLIGCLNHLVKMGVNPTSEDREEFIEKYKAQLLSLSSCQSMLQKARNKARKLAENAERTFQREEITSFFKKLDTLSVTSATLDLANATDDLANAKSNLFETKLKVDAYNKIIIEPLSTDENPTRKRKHSNRLETPPRRSSNSDALLDTPNKRQMSDEKVIH